MKRLCLLVCACLLLTLALVACDKGGKQEAHTHTYADAWSFDEDQHWYAASCEHTEERANVSAHEDAENDGVCDVCGYGSDHVHTFAEAWSTDGESHWHATTCGHDVKDALGAHADADNDDACDVCAHSGGCEHPVNAEAWLSDAEGHWHAASCGHTVKLDVAAHADGNNDGACDVCAWEDPNHTHTYKTEYAFDDHNHWFDADCGHTLKGEVAAHTDADNDGACDTCPWNDGCTHEYSMLWSMDGTYHWRAVTCTHTIAPADKAEHTDADLNGLCDVCGYQDHEHTYNTESWTHNDTAHWHAATCGCSIKQDEAAHADTNNDGACEVCAWNDGCLHPVDEDAWTFNETHHWHGVTCTHTIAPTDQTAHFDLDLDGNCDACDAWDFSHTHTYADTLTVDADTHYYAATCEHVGSRKDEEQHIDHNGDGKCDVCGGTASLQLIIDKVTSQDSADKINGGSVINTGIYHFEDSDEPYVSTEIITYEFGNGYLHTNDGVYDRWFTLLADGSVFAARMIDGAYETESASADNMAGYYFNGNFLYYNVDAYGVEGLLYNLYSFAQVNGSNLCARYDAASGAYGFDFAYDNQFGSLYFVTVWFSFDHSGALTDLHIASSVYSVFAQNEHGKYYVMPDAAPGYEYELIVTQSVGERTAVNEHGPEKFIFSSYDFADESGNVYGDTITLAPGQAVYLYFANANPATASTKLDNFNISTDAKSSQLYSYLAWSGEYVYVKGIAAGTYTLTVTSTNVTKVITIIVGTPEIKGLTPMVYYKDHTGLYTTTVGKTYTLYAGQTLYFGAMANPSAANAAFTATVSGGTLGTSTITYGSEKVKVSSFTASEQGTYTITLTSTENAAITTTLTVQVLPEPTVGDILNGSYMANIFDYNYSSYSSCDILVTFAPASAGATNGTVTIVRNDQTEVLSYVYENGAITLTHASGSVLGYTLALNDQYSVTIGWTYDGAQRESIMLEYNYTNRVFAKTWVSDVMVDGETPLYTFVFGDQGYVYDASNYTYPDMLSTVDNVTGAITVTFLDSVAGTELAGIVSLTFDPEANTITLVLADRTVTLTPAAY